VCVCLDEQKKNAQKNKGTANTENKKYL